jgi:hypothetical protein
MSKKFWSFKKTPAPAIKVDKNELKKKLTPIQYRVTQEAATERYERYLIVIISIFMLFTP